jgi:hypothetical protein
MVKLLVAYPSLLVVVWGCCYLLFVGVGKIVEWLNG